MPLNYKKNYTNYQILPADIVPEGKTADDNLNVFQEGDIPQLFDGALPHWELAKNTI